MVSLLNSVVRLFAAPCQPKQQFFGFPTWYKYLNGITDAETPPRCMPQLQNLADVWLIVAAMVEVLLRIAAVASLIMVVYGGVLFVMSQGEADRTKQARETIFNALIGLVISVAATGVITFAAGRANG